jgi:aminoglycoside/choline kinase family phosphotransferase
VIIKVDIKNNIKNLFETWSGEKAQVISAMPQSGSYRQYYRISGNSKSAIGAFNPDHKENKAFITFTKHFRSIGLNVPEFYLDDKNSVTYLIEDLGDVSLFSFLSENRNLKEFPEKVTSYYKNSLEHLIRFQFEGSEGLDYSVCYPRSSFDKQSIMWDLNYFKYYFLKLTKIVFDEQLLENDFNKFAEFLLSAEMNNFMYRDFQSHNIMIKDEKLYFIDYQGGRKGALQYDVASLLYDAKADVPQKIRDELVEFYIQHLNRRTKINRKEFLNHYYGYILIRILQAMGAYGFRGLYENKAHFLKSIPYSIKNLKYLIDNNLLPDGFPELRKSIVKIINNDELSKFGYHETQDKLKVTINSFSYKNGIPLDLSGNGGGFVFDCRALPNPGRLEKFKELTGRNKEVIFFLENESTVNNFLENVSKISEVSIKNYIERKFTSLVINFGCTGGQHRSVYSAEKLSTLLKNKFDINVEVNHTGLEQKGES